MSKASEAIKAEVEAEQADEIKPVRFEFEGGTYEVQPKQPSPKALEYLGEYIDRNSAPHAVLFVRQSIGQAGWDEWCKRHETSDILPMVHAVNAAFSGN